MIKYPNGVEAKNKKVKVKTRNPLVKSGNRGMVLENEINLSNAYYKEKGLCLITKRPTPINIVKVDYTRGARIIDAYFEKQSTTDYNGVYKSRYIDFEAKSTHSKSSLPLSNIPKQQIEHLKQVIKHGGIAFFIIQFVPLSEAYLLDAQYVLHFKDNATRQSLPYSYVKENGYLIKTGYNPRIDYLEIVEKIYFSDKK